MSTQLDRVPDFPGTDADGASCLFAGEYTIEWLSPKDGPSRLTVRMRYKAPGDTITPEAILEHLWRKKAIHDISSWVYEPSDPSDEHPSVFVFVMKAATA